MCGVFGYVGDPVDLGGDLLRGLTTLEYRGYDSWGIALGRNQAIEVDKRVGRIAGATTSLAGSDIGFGHTRWATHGGVSEPNAHPHLDCSGRLAIVHNGIIENHRELRTELLARGHAFRSATDSEVVAHLLEEHVGHGEDLGQAVAAVFARLQGLNAIVAMDVVSRRLVATKHVSPLVAGWGERGAFIASDALALRPYLDLVVYLEDDHLALMDRDGLRVVDRATLEPIDPPRLPLDRNLVDVGLGGHRHFMAKEMAEQPGVIERLAAEQRPAIEAMAEQIRANGTVLVGCGTALNAALTGRYLFARLAQTAVDVVPASEFAYHEPVVRPGSLVIALSQSGETADVIEAMTAARRRGARLGAIVNTPHSTLDRLVDHRVLLGAGPEQCVLATKSYTAMIATLLLTAHALRGTYEEGAGLVRRAAEGLNQMLKPASLGLIEELAGRIHRSDHLFVVGRGLAYPSALEAALKIKEVSYIHAEGFASGELKHGVIALVSDGTPCLVYAPADETRADVLSGAAELKSRGGFVVGIGPEPDPIFDAHLAVPDVGDAAPIVNALPAQLLGYHAALLRGNDPDRPRNLAKSVTVK